MVALLNYVLGIQRGPDGREYEIITGTTNLAVNTRTPHTITQAKPVDHVEVLAYCRGNVVAGTEGFNTGVAVDLGAQPQFPPQYFEHDAVTTVAYDAGPPEILARSNVPAPTVSSFCEIADVDFVAKVVYGGEGYAGGSSV